MYKIIIFPTMLQRKYIHLTVYAFIFTMYGIITTAVGPILIYYSRITGQDETYYSFIFFSRALGYLAGGILFKMFSSRFNYYSIYRCIIITCGISLVVSSLNFQFVNQAITMLIASACSCTFSILGYICIYRIFSRDNLDYWTQSANIFFGIGGLTGPIIVVAYQEMALRFIGVACFFLVLPFFFLEYPQTQQQVIQQKGRKASLQLKRIPQALICTLFLIFTAVEVGYAGWVPTYALKAGVAQEKQASSLSSIFWLTNVLGRSILLFWSACVTRRLRILLQCLVFSTICLLIFQWIGWLRIVSYAGVLSSGFFLAPMYALLFSVAVQYNYFLSPSDSANFSIFCCLGEGILVMPIGYAMGYFGYKALAYIIFLLSALMYGIFEFLIKSLEQDSRQESKQKSIQLLDIKQYQC